MAFVGKKDNSQIHGKYNVVMEEHALNQMEQNAINKHQKLITTLDVLR